MKKVLFVNGSYNEIPLIEAAHKLGYYVITSGNDEKGEGHKYSDEYVPCDYSDKESIYKLAKKLHVDGICSCGNDFGALSAAYASEKLNLNGHDSYHNCRYFHEKDKFKELCDTLCISTPRSYVFTDFSFGVVFLEKAIFPLIIKPNDLGGGKGISIVSDIESGLIALEKAFQVSKSKVVLIEEYIDGPQFGYTCFIKDKSIAFDYLSQDYSYLNPFMVWSAVANFPDEYCELRSIIRHDVKLLSQYLNVYDGFLTIQLKVKDNKPYYIETMRRCLGNMHYICISNDFHFDAYELFLANELGLNTDDYLAKVKEQQQASAFMGLYANCNGKYLGYEVDDRYKKLLFYKYEVEKRGFIITNYLSEKIGMIYLSFNSKEERDSFICDMKSIVSVEVEEQ
ncbi:MAG: hypothetical protein J6X93_06500 [Bacilli bacterium]|nr:hypothetical protein [Bacilli bacterium]